MRNKKLPIDLDGLWANDNDKFVVRYKDIAQKQQQLLAKAIKENAIQWSIKKTTGPTPEIIGEALEEINPIIFSQYTGPANWYRGHQKFSISAATYIAGYKFRKLCQAIFLLTCRKKALTPHQIRKITYLTEPSWEIADPYVNERLHIHEEEDEEERVTPIEDIGMDDIRRARLTTQERRGNRIEETPYPIINPRRRLQRRVTIRNGEIISENIEVEDNDNEEETEDPYRDTLLRTATPTPNGTFGSYYLNTHPEPNQTFDIITEPLHAINETQIQSIPTASEIMRHIGLTGRI